MSEVAKEVKIRTESFKTQEAPEFSQKVLVSKIPKMLSEAYSIHVPQGRTARLTKESLKHGIKSLFTNGISICHIVILVGRNGISVTHADLTVTRDAIQAECDFLGEVYKKIILYREKENLFKKVYSEETLVESPVFIRHIWSDKSVSDKSWVRFPIQESDTIIAHLEENLDSKPFKNVIFLENNEKPENLLRHPNEQAFLCAHKIEEAFYMSFSTFIVKQHLIFDGIHWESIPESEFTPFRNNDPSMKEHMDFILQDRKFMAIRDRLIAVRNKILEKVKMNTGIELHCCPFESLSFSQHFQDYQNAESKEVIFFRDLEEILTKMKPVAKKDSSFILSLKNCLKRKDKTYEEILQLVQGFRSTPKTDFKETFNYFFWTASVQYTEKLMYQQNQERFNQTRNQTKKLFKEAIEFLIAKNYASAYEIYMKIYALSWCYKKEDMHFIKLHSNIGFCLYELRHYEQASYFFKISLDLRVQTNQGLDASENLKSKIAECATQISMVDKENVPLVTQFAALSSALAAKLPPTEHRVLGLSHKS